jgi:hypothetical protein
LIEFAKQKNRPCGRFFTASSCELEALGKADF